MTRTIGRKLIVLMSDGVLVTLKVFITGKNGGRASMHCWNPLCRMVEGHLFWDNQTYANQIGICQ